MSVSCAAALRGIFAWTGFGFIFSANATLITDVPTADDKPPFSTTKSAQASSGYSDHFSSPPDIVLSIRFQGDYELEYRFRTRLERTIPANVTLNYAWRYGDSAVLDVRATDITFEEKMYDSKLREKKYPKYLRREGLSKCNRMESALFDEETKEIQVRYNIHTALSVDGDDISRNLVTHYKSERYKTAKNLRAFTPCGSHATDIFPNDTIRDRFNVSEQRDEAYEKLMSTIAYDLATAVSRDIADHMAELGHERDKGYGRY